MAKKVLLKVRLVPEKKNPIVPFFIMLKNQQKEKKQKLNLKLKNIIQLLENTKFLLKKTTPTQ